MTVEVTGNEFSFMHRNDVGLYWRIHHFDTDRIVGIAKYATPGENGRQYWQIRTADLKNQIQQELNISTEALYALINLALSELDADFSIDSKYLSPYIIFVEWLCG